MKSEIRDGQSNTWYRANWTLATHYDHAERFMMDLVLAANGSNRSYPAKWAFSPTLGLGYIFVNNPDGFMNYGKFRASAGIQHVATAADIVTVLTGFADTAVGTRS